MKRNSGGFTLVELIVVIVILGILAVTAAPKFMDLQGDARRASLQGVQGALNSAKSLAFGKALLNGVEKNATGTIKVNGQDVDLIYGYPKATSDVLSLVMDLDLTDTAGSQADYFISEVGSDGKEANIFTYDSGKTNNSDYDISTYKCYVNYKISETTAADGTVTADAKATLFATGC
ncbi:MAG: prepilin-type N-terminal cleavage/methylation domain-containing protein [Succinivibrionaceae bacterium]|nr:prepilin-type N-terminal cleavage/methylation domain-containing protein [Succinivibrionaceae bacterium]